MARRPMPTPDVIGQLMSKSRPKPEDLPTRQVSARLRTARMLEQMRNERYGKRAPFRLPDELVDRLRARAKLEEVPVVGLAQWALRYGLDALESGKVVLPKIPRGYKIKE